MNLLEINIDKLAEILKTDFERGLTDAQAEKNRIEFGDNSKGAGEGYKFGDIFRRLVSDLMTVLFVALSVISGFFMGEKSSLLCLALALVFLGCQACSYIYDKRINKKINKYRGTKVKVTRNGKEELLDSRNLVAGDIIHLKRGDILPADALIVKQEVLRALEFHLTGRVVPAIKKSQKDAVESKRPYFECILFAGTLITSGSADAIICNTGDNIFNYKKNGSIRKNRSESMPKIFKNAAQYGKQLSLIWILFCFIMFVVGLVYDYEVFKMFYLCAAMAVCALADFVSVLAELTIDFSAQKLMKQGAVLKNPAAIDRLCDVNCIIVNNTKYFLYNKPIPNIYFTNTVIHRFDKTLNDKGIDLYRACMATVSEGDIAENNSLTYNGSSINKSILDFGEKLSLSQNGSPYKVIAIDGFRPNDGTNLSFVCKDEEFLLLMKGPYDSVISKCKYRVRNGERRFLDSDEKRRLMGIAAEMTDSGEYVIAVAKKVISKGYDGSPFDQDKDMTFMGLIGFYTPIMAASAKAVNLCNKANVDTVFMTDDPIPTIKGLSETIGVMNKNSDKAITSAELSKTELGLFLAGIDDYKVYSCLKQHQKQKVIKYRKEDGDIVAAVTTGLRESLAQIESDISIVDSDEKAPGVLHNADVVLKESSFELIPECIRYARSVYHNIRHMLQYVMTLQFLLSSSLIAAMIFEKQIVLTPGAMLVFGILVALPNAISVTREPPSKKILSYPPGYEDRGFSKKNLFVLPMTVGVLTGILSILVYGITLFSGSGRALASAFLTVSFGGIFAALSFKTDENLWKSNPFSNHSFIATALFSVAVSFLFVCYPPLASLCGFTLPKVWQFILSFVFGTIPAAVNEAIKYYPEYLSLKEDKKTENNKDEEEEGIEKNIEQ